MCVKHPTHSSFVIGKFLLFAYLSNPMTYPTSCPKSSCLHSPTHHHPQWPSLPHTYQHRTEPGMGGSWWPRRLFRGSFLSFAVCQNGLLTPGYENTVFNPPLIDTPSFCRTVKIRKLWLLQHPLKPLPTGLTHRAAWRQSPASPTLRHIPSVLSI